MAFIKIRNFSVCEKTFFHCSQQTGSVEILANKDKLVGSIAPLFMPVLLNLCAMFQKTGVGEPFFEGHTAPPNTCAPDTDRTTSLTEVYDRIGTRGEPEQPFCANNCRRVVGIEIIPPPFGVKGSAVPQYARRQTVFFSFWGMNFLQFLNPSRR